MAMIRYENECTHYKIRGNKEIKDAKSGILPNCPLVKGDAQ
jgi:hypothetical protein